MVIPTFLKDGAGDEGGTKQGRITAKGSAAPQTWPPPIQECIRSRWDNGIIIWLDLDQIELKVAALLSGDKAMVTEYLKPKPDLHAQMAIEQFGPQVVEDPHWRGGDNRLDPRQWGGKVPNFLILYRGGPDKLQVTILSDCGRLVPLEQCQLMVTNAREARPGLWEYQERLIRIARRDGYLEIPFIGQSRYFMGGQDWDVNEIVNMPIQTTAGNVLLRIQAYLHRRLPALNALSPSVFMFHNIYDAIIFDCKDRASADAAKALCAEAVNYVATQEYWHWLEVLHDRHIPLTFSIDEVTHASNESI